MAKSDRLLYLVNLIKSNHNSTAKQLAEKCGVSERTIFRYINSLATASLPIYYDHGYKFMDNAFLPTINLTDEELSTLQFAFDFSPIKSNPYLSNLAKSILAKLETSRKNSFAPKGTIRSERLPGSSPSKEEKVASSVSQDVIRFTTTFRELKRAIAQKKVANVVYQKEEYSIEPFAMVQRNLTWVVLCYLRNIDRVVSLDINRIENLSLTTQISESGFSLEKLLDASQPISAG